MGWFTQNNDDDIDDIYDKLDDIYDKLEALDVVTAFSGRLSKLEKTSSYLENVLLDNIRDLEKRIIKLEERQENLEYDLTNVNHSIFDIKEERGDSKDDTKSNIDADVMFEVDYIREEIKSLKNILKDNDLQGIRSEFSSQINEVDEAIKNLMVKVSYLELSKDRVPNYSQEIETLKGKDLSKDVQIKKLQEKVDALNKIVEESVQNLKLVAKYVINQNRSIRYLEDELYELTGKDHS